MQPKDLSKTSKSPCSADSLLSWSTQQLWESVQSVRVLKFRVLRHMRQRHGLNLVEFLKTRGTHLGEGLAAPVSCAALIKGSQACGDQGPVNVAQCCPPIAEISEVAVEGVSGAQFCDIPSACTRKDRVNSEKSGD